MKRNVLWLLSTITVVVLLFGYRTSEGATVTSRTGASVVSPLSPGASTSTSEKPSADSGGSSSTPPKPSVSANASPIAGTYTGDSAMTQWGAVQVAITVADGRITAVDVPVYPNGNGRDYEINSYALPTLVQETLSAQNANIDMVSGATVTSGGYLQSLQSALDKAGL